MMACINVWKSVDIINLTSALFFFRFWEFRVIKGILRHRKCSENLRCSQRNGENCSGRKPSGMQLVWAGLLPHSSTSGKIAVKLDMGLKSEQKSCS